MRELAFQAQAGGLLLFVRLSPNAGRDELQGVATGPEGPVLRAKVRAIPDKGRANTALIELVAGWLRLPKTTISLKAGSTSRSKTLLIEGDAAALAERLDAAVAALAAVERASAGKVRA